MKDLMKNALALLIVFSAAMTHASDSSSLYSVCKVWVQEDETAYRVIFNSTQKENVQVKIYNGQNQVVYSEDLKSESFSKKYDMSLLPRGQYRISVTSGEDEISETMEVGNLEGFNFMISSLQGRSLSLVGSQQAGKSLTVAISDQNGELIFQESYEDTKQLHKKFNLGQIKGESVTVKLYHRDALLKEELVVLR